MANFNLTITDEGAAFLADVIANQGNIDFTEMRFSSTNYVGQESTVTEGTWTGTFITATPSASVVDSTTINVAASFDNSTFTSSKSLYSIGIVATDGNNTALVAVATSSVPQTIPEFVSTASHYAYNLNLAVSSTSNITVSASTAGALYVFDIVDNLTSTATNKPLSANQGKALSEAKQNKELATPITIGGTSQTTVEGAIGGLNSVKADKTDISSIIATGATNTTGATITAGTYFYLNGVLVKAKADIANGASYTDGTNYEAVTVGGLNALKNELNDRLVATGTGANNAAKLQSLASSFSALNAAEKRNCYLIVVNEKLNIGNVSSAYFSGTLVAYGGGNVNTIIDGVCLTTGEYYRVKWVNTTMSIDDLSSSNFQIELYVSKSV